jgi:predicted permease
MPGLRSFADALLQDTRYAARGLRRNPVLTCSVVFTLAFGIGLNTGVFSVLSGMAFRARAEKDSASFLQILTPPAAQPDATPRLFASSTNDLAAFRTSRSVSRVAAWAVSAARLDDDPRADLLLNTTCDFFAVYGLDRAYLGRLFGPSDCAVPAGGASAALIGENLWRERFHADPRVVGHTIRLNRQPFIVIGVVPAAFDGRLRGPGIWIPYRGGDYARGGLTIEGKLRPGHSREEAAREFAVLARRPVAITDGSLLQDPSGKAIAASVAVLLTGVLGLLLLLACANVTILLLSRAAARRYEIAVRLSLGASRARLLQMAGTEGILLAAIAGGFAAFFAAAIPGAVRALIPRMPYYPMHTDWPVFLYLAGITLAAGCIAGLVPAAECLRAELSGSLKHAGRRSRLRDLLIAAQVAMSMVLVIGAALFARAQYRLFYSDPGFDAQHLIVAQLPGANAEIGAVLRAIPGVRSVAFASSILGSRFESTTAVSQEFFATVQLPVLHGRPLDPAFPHRVVVSEAAGRSVGESFTTPDGGGWEVGGIVPGSDLDRRSPAPRVFRPLPAGTAAPGMVVRFAGDPEQVTRAIGGALTAAGLEPRDLPHTLASELAELGSRFRPAAGTAVFFGVSAFVLAMTGVYGVVAFAVSQRTREIGIRLALGATRADIVRDVMRIGRRPVAWGLALGVPLAILTAALLGRIFRATPTPFRALDPPAFAAVALLLATGATAAMLRPAIRASAADPAASLHDE